jgi:drug/metabolite transporter (DMT)-like permease
VRHWRAEAALLGNTVIWGATFVLVKNALADISPFVFLCFRFSVAGLLLSFIYRRRFHSPATARSLRWGALAGFFLFAGYAFQTVGLQFTTPSKSAFITGLAIPLVPFLNSLVYRIRPVAAEIAGVCIATAGMGLLTMQGQRLAIGSGDLLTLGCAVSFAAHILILGHFSTIANHGVLSVAQIVTPALLAGMMFSWAETPRITWSTTVIAAVAICGVLATALPFTIQAWAQQHTSATRTALIFALEPVVAWFVSWLLTGEVLSPQSTGGAILILAGILLVELKPFAPEQHPSH